ncbi:NeuD/PglB/VioB family sugar acetyltransferase [Sulfurimonas sp. SAG-AH-194-C20]|nr:NeuD/PglB/VioB family sugar acetyltransferase [Sulfurimonas sp. SAG-AH-194-C20]MDF1879477.1 NeuD/PglB/VioB family sugar acetyltransferase [Sulfurimonas sp. SAG-AH-194-C20]
MREEILLIGGGGHCKSVIDVIEQEDRFIIAGIVDKKELLGSKVLGYEVVGCDDDLKKLHEKYKNIMITVGHIKSNSVRVKLFHLVKSIGYTLPTIISPLAYVSKHSFVDEGSVVMHQALVNANANIGKNCIINTKALVEHDAIVENNCHISTSAVINGGTIIKENTFFGSNATSKEYVTVENFVKAGSVVK